MQFDVHLGVPPTIWAGLQQGQLVRHGGVVLHAPGTSRGGEIAAWLRETSASPALSAHLPQALASVLQLTSPVTSVLTLGATVAFGAAALRKLVSMERQFQAGFSDLHRHLADIEGGMSKLQRTVDLGFVTMRAGLERLEAFAEASLEGRLRAAIDLAMSVFELPPDDHRRRQSLPIADGQALQAKHEIFLLLDRDFEELALRWSRRTVRLRVAAEDASALVRFRQACVACATHAAIAAEQGDVRRAAATLRSEVAQLRVQLEGLGRLILGEGDDRRLGQLLSITARESGIRPGRVAAWARRFDSELKSLDQVVEWLQDHGALASNSKPGWTAETRKVLPKFADAFDGAWEDLDRLDGRAAEYGQLAMEGGSCQEHRDRLRLDDIPDRPAIATVMPAEPAVSDILR